ncbi:MAG: response regulator [Caulobacteraceae bacterium]
MADALAKVLVAEDDTAIRELIQTQLRLAGYETFSAHNGREALDRVRDWRPQAMLLDINMPVLDGFGVLEELKTADPERRVAVMVLTARHSGEDVRRAIALGAKDFLRKPFTHTDLVNRVRRLLRPRPSAYLQG